MIRLTTSFACGCILFSTIPTWASSTGPLLEYDQRFDQAAFAMVVVANDRFGAARRPEAAPEPVRDEAPEATAPRIEYELVLFAVSDFRRGGISASAGKPALQAQFSAQHSSGIYGSIWGSTLAGSDADAEIDLALGYTFPIGSLEADVGAIAYLFPGQTGGNYVELQAGLSRTVGDVTLSGALAYTPAQTNTGNRDNIYAGVEVELPIKNTPLSVNGAFGFENGAFGDSKLDWQVGARYDLNTIRLGIDYIDAARVDGVPHADATLVFSATKVFR